MKQDNTKKATQKHRKPALVAEPCLYCGEMTLSGDYIINPGAKHELPCCSEECFIKTKAFVDYDAHHRMLFYGILFVMVVANLFVFGFKMVNQWMYLPMLGMGIAACVYPLVFTRYERYQRFGIRKTKRIIRIIALGISAFALLLTICY
jgi:hypothetical protein